MYKYILQGAGAINWMAIFALLTFLGVFLSGVWVVMIKSKAELDRAANIPLQDDPQDIN